MKQFFTLALVLTASLSLIACSGIQSEAKYPTGADRAATGGNNIYANAPSVLGEGGLLGKKDSSSDQGGVAVNSYLWRASLDTLSFMPMASADPFGGTIITDWYADPNAVAGAKNERTKINAFILGRELKASNLRVKAFRQVASNGAWKDAAVSPATERALEDAILTRARQLRVAKDDGLF